MSCPKTEYLLVEYFSNEISDIARQEMESHLRGCHSCNQELASLLLVQRNLEGWHDHQVPHWDRGLELFRREHRSAEKGSPGFGLWRWLPTATSFAMLLLVVLNTNLVIGDQGMSISFGSASPGNAALEARLTTFKQDRQAELAEFVARIENRQDANNMQLMQVVFDQTQQVTAENLERVYAFFEEQRLQDLEDMRVGYQALIDNDYETFRSLEQLAQFVSFSDEVR